MGESLPPPQDNVTFPPGWNTSEFWDRPDLAERVQDIGRDVQEIFDRMIHATPNHPSTGEPGVFSHFTGDTHLCPVYNSNGTENYFVLPEDNPPQQENIG